VPRAALSDVLSEVKALINRSDWRISFPIEVRVTPADDLWLSTAYKRDSAYIAIHVFRTAQHEEYFREVEAIMTAVGGRPHWGKMHSRDADYLAGVYPRLADFVAIRNSLDPDRRFGNDYLTQVLGA
jgi:FAD/FMN-containing dehydrogenase